MAGVCVELVWRDTLFQDKGKMFGFYDLVGFSIVHGITVVLHMVSIMSLFFS